MIITNYHWETTESVRYILVVWGVRKYHWFNFDTAGRSTTVDTDGFMYAATRCTGSYHSPQPFKSLSSCTSIDLKKIVIS